MKNEITELDTEVNTGTTMANKVTAIVEYSTSELGDTIFIVKSLISAFVSNARIVIIDAIRRDFFSLHKP
jgi:hypothetical protein